jgi:hypothetical protein
MNVVYERWVLWTSKREANGTGWILKKKEEEVKFVGIYKLGGRTSDHSLASSDWVPGSSEPRGRSVARHESRRKSGQSGQSGKPYSPPLIRREVAPESLSTLLKRP